MPQGQILIVCGFTAEARIARGDGVVTIAGGGSSAALAERLAASDPAQFAAIISFGLAGALEPGLKPGDVIIASAIVAGETRPCSDALRMSWAHLGFRTAAIAGVDAPVLTSAAKAALRARTGAAAVDMESHIAAAFAAHHALPFGAIRVISDAADHVLPPVAAHAMRPDGGIAIGAVIAGLVRRPGQLPALLATARDAGRAVKALRQARAALGRDFGIVA